MERRIDGPDRDRASVHPLEHAVEILALQWEKFVQRLPSIGFVVGKDHPLDYRDAALAEEHVLGAAQSDASRAKRVCQLGLIRQVGVRANPEAAILIRARENP